jgi:uncharacterized protein DUF4845
MPVRHRQSGISFVGFIFVAIMVLALALLGFRVAPSYIEYFTVEKILHQMMSEGKEGLTLSQVQRDFDRRAGVDYVDSVRGRDIELTKDGNVITISASWTTTLHLVGNVSLLLDFTASASK